MNAQAAGVVSGRCTGVGPSAGPALAARARPQPGRRARRVSRWLLGALLGATALPGTAAGQRGDSSTAERFLQSMDRNGDGLIARGEWSSSGASFLQYDADLDAYLSLEELSHDPGKGRPKRTDPGTPDLSGVSIAIGEFSVTPPAYFTARCTACHDTARILIAAKDAVAWAQAVERMAAKEEAEIPPRDVRRITDFLDAQREQRARASSSYGTADPVAAWAAVLDRSDLHRHDRDGNGRLTANEVGRLLIECLDFDGDGDLNAGEFRLMPLARAEFQHLDRNHDGQVTSRELGVPDGLWQVLDQDGDRALSMEELPRRRAGPFRFLFGLDAAWVLEQLDRNRDGKISRKEVRNGEDVFLLADRNRDNELDGDELQNALDRARGAGAVGAFDDVITRYDLDGDGGVGRGEFPGPLHLFRRCDANGDGAIDEKDAPPGYQRPEFDDDARRWRTTYRIVR